MAAETEGWRLPWGLVLSKILNLKEHVLSRKSNVHCESGLVLWHPLHKYSSKMTRYSSSATRAWRISLQLLSARLDRLRLLVPRPIFSSTWVSLENANSLLSEAVSRFGCLRVSLKQGWIFLVTLLPPCFATSFKAFIPLC